MHPLFLKKNFELKLLKKCTVCGCTDDDCSQCIEKTGSPCYWVSPDLCSACANTKYHPLLFSTLMVQALPRKKQTRRINGLEIINKNPDSWELSRVFDGYAKFCEKHNWINEKHIKCPYGKPGDVLWVRESFLYNDDLDLPYSYKSDWNNEYQQRMKSHWKPSIHMPKEACRHFLLIKDIRVERLQSISEKDAQAEGALQLTNMHSAVNNVNTRQPNYRTGFAKIWITINGEESYTSNPWVWVIEFEKIEKPNNFI